MIFRARRIVAVLLSASLSLAAAIGAAAPATATTFTSPVQIEGAPGNPSSGIEFQGNLYFSGTDPEGNRRLYSYDGSSFRIVDAAHQYPAHLLVANDLLYYSAIDADRTWHFLSYDGNDWTDMGPTSEYASIESTVLPGSTDLMLSVPVSDDETRLERFSQGSTTLIDTYRYATDLVAFGTQLYFTGMLTGTDYYQMFRTDGTTSELARPSAGIDMTVWNGNMYLGFFDQNYAFYRMQPDLSLHPAVVPNIGFAFNFTPVGDQLFFTGDGGGAQVLYSFDGESATPIAGSPNNVNDLAVIGADLFFTGDRSTVQVCALDVTPDCAEFGHLYQFDGSSITYIADTPGYSNGLIAFNGRLYFDDGTRWMMIEPASTLPNTGFEVATFGFASATLFSVGLALVLIRRRNRELVTG